MARGQERGQETGTKARAGLAARVAAILLGMATVACNPSTAETGLQRFAVGELAKLEILAAPPAQPDIMFLNAEGERLTLESFRGKVLVLNLWATWCAPCVKEMPSLDRLQAQLGSDQFEVVSISFDRSMADAGAWYEENGIGSLALYQDSSTAMARLLSTESHPVDGIPITVVYDPEGVELARLSNGAEWDSPEALELIRTVIDRSFTDQAAG